ncbi:hypothetical protein WI23_07525 [Burkholderia oklahomensis C6786]|nr:hypothetical protein WI23_07525 [Burkholderia oklahomensis C6786]KUY64834.1 hypothetical protein WI23_06055 [Burkholderia oklahomensis C6786]
MQLEPLSLLIPLKRERFEGLRACCRRGSVFFEGHLVGSCPSKFSVAEFRRIRIQLADSLQRLVVALPIRRPTLVFIGDADLEVRAQLGGSLDVKGRIVLGRDDQALRQLRCRLKGCR